MAALFDQMTAVRLPSPKRQDREAIENNAFGGERYQSEFKNACKRLLSTLKSRGAERPALQLSEIRDWLQYSDLSENSKSTRKEILEVKFDKLIRAHAPQALLSPEKPESAEKGWLWAHAHGWNEQQLRQALLEVGEKLEEDAGIWWSKRFECDCYNNFWRDAEAFLVSLPDLRKGLNYHIQREMKLQKLEDLAPILDKDSKRLARDMGWDDKKLADEFNERIRSCKLPSGTSMSGDLMEGSKTYQWLLKQSSRLCMRSRNKVPVTKTKPLYRKKDTRPYIAFGSAASFTAVLIATKSPYIAGGMGAAVGALAERLMNGYEEVTETFEDYELGDAGD